jgi:hypothetical protein
MFAYIVEILKFLDVTVMRVKFTWDVQSSLITDIVIVIVIVIVWDRMLVVKCKCHGKSFSCTF